MGFSVDKISESNEESPDFLVDDGSTLHLVELKTRGDDSDRERARNEALDLGEIHAEVIPFIRKNRISGIIKKVQSQLASNNDVGGSSRLVWMAAIERNQHAKKEQILATLYGQTGVVDIRNDPLRKHCYYFYNSDFFRYRNILDGAILSWEDSAVFCLNSYSPNANDVRESNVFIAVVMLLCIHLRNSSNRRPNTGRCHPRSATSQPSLSWIKGGIYAPTTC